MAIYKNTPPIVTNGLVLYLDAANRISYPGSGTTWSDMSGVGNNGTLGNGPTFSTSAGGSIVFDGTNDFCSMSFQWPSDFTINMWVNPILNASAGSFPRMVSTGPGDNFEIAISNTGQISYYPGGGWISNIITIDKNIWVDLTVVKNGSTIVFYTNGTSRYTGGISVIPGGTSLYIGARYIPGEPSNTSIASFQVYNRVLSINEITQNYNATKTRFGLT